MTSCIGRGASQARRHNYYANPPVGAPHERCRLPRRPSRAPRGLRMRSADLTRGATYGES